MRRQRAAGHLLCLLCLALLTGCLTRTTAPGADMAYGQVGAASYTYLRWPEGLRILVWHDPAEAATCGGSGSTQEPDYRILCDVQLANGRSLVYAVETRVGVNAQFELNGTPYDLADGNVLIVSSSGSSASVTQLQRDLANLSVAYDDIAAFAAADPDLAPLVSPP
ncbi:MAG: hypothetical protein KC425_03610 [Anaerolineales bacterium]|nr:hypothetical protein [Anaerolineales bacterium]